MPARLALLAAATFAAAVQAAEPADRVLLNGAVYTVDAARSWASAIAVRGDRILYVGDEAGARVFIAPTTRVIDLGGRMVLPGFHDSHVHPGMVPNPDTALALHGITARDALFAKIRAFAEAHPDKHWITGEGWDEVTFLPSGKPTRQMLDALVPDRPAYLVNNSGHQAWANTRALEIAGIGAETPDPLNGRIEREPGGQPDGSLQEESAMALVSAHIPPPTPAETERDLVAALELMTRHGVTALEDAMATPAIAEAYRALDSRGALNQHARLCLPHRPEADDDAQVEEFIRQRKALAGRRLRADCVKLFLDGAYGSHTLVLLEPYSDEPERFGKGKLFIEEGRLHRLVTRLDAEGFQLHVHAQGDGAVRAALDAFAAARQANGVRDNRNTIAHLCLIDAADLPRFRELGVSANFSPSWILGDTWETVFAPRLFGPERTKRLYQTRSLLATGTQLVWGTDWPVTGVSPLDGLETAVTHRYPGGKDPNGAEDKALNPDERIDLGQAIVAYTSAGAHLLHHDRERGSLEPGKRADFVVLDRNLFAGRIDQIHLARVDATWVDGQPVFVRDGALPGESIAR